MLKRYYKCGTAGGGQYVWQGEGSGRPAGCFKSPSSSCSTFSMTHICYIERASEQDKVWKKSSAVKKKKKKVHNFCFRTQVKIFQMSRPLYLQMVINRFTQFLQLLLIGPVIWLSKKMKKPKAGKCLRERPFQIVHLAKGCVKLDITLLSTTTPT